MEYKDFFNPKTLEKLNKKSAENLKSMIGDKNLMQTIMSSTQLLSQISKAENPHKQQLEKLAVDMVKELYPIIDEEGIVLDAKIDSITSVTGELDEIKVNNPYSKNLINKIFSPLKDTFYELTGPLKGLTLAISKPTKGEFNINTEEGDTTIVIQENDKTILQGTNNLKNPNLQLGGYIDPDDPNFPAPLPNEEGWVEARVSETVKAFNTIQPNSLVYDDSSGDFALDISKSKLAKYLLSIPSREGDIDFSDIWKPLSVKELSENISPESRRRIINSITQGAALRGAFAFYLFKEHLDELDPSLVEKYNQIMKNSFGIYDDENAIAMMLSLLAQGQKIAGGSSKVIINEIKVNNPSLFSQNHLNTKLNKTLLDYTSVEDSATYPTIEDTLRGREYEPYPTQLNYNKIKEILLPFYPKAEHLIEKWVDKINDDYFDYYPFYDEYDIKTFENISIEELLNRFKEFLKTEINEIKINKPKKPSSLNEDASSNITIRARAANFPMLIHELIKGLYELISLQGFKGSKEERQATADKVDLLKNEPSDIRYGKFIYDALNKVFINNEYNDPRIREFFFAEVYQLEDNEFISFIENAVNEELTSIQQKWANSTLRDISIDLKADDYDTTGLDEIKVNKPLTATQIANKIFNPKNENITYKLTGPLKGLYLDINRNSNPHAIDSAWGEAEIHDNSNFRTNFEFSLLIDFIEFGEDLKNGENFKDRIPEQIKKYNSIYPNTLTSYQPVKSYLSPEWSAKIYKKDLVKYINPVPIKNLYEVKINKPPLVAESFLEGMNQAVKLFIENKTKHLNLLREFTEKTINDTIERWKIDEPEIDDDIAKRLIQRFDQIKSGLSNKLDLVVLPDELKQKNNYLNIDRYTFDSMDKLIKSLPEDVKKIKKSAVKRFIEKYQIDKASAQSYVSRFMQNRNSLKVGTEQGLDDLGFTKEEILKYIPKKLQRQNAFLDPQNWDWKSFEGLLDAIFPSQRKEKEGEGNNLATTDADKIYNKNGIEIYRGDDVHKCISYNPTNPETKMKKYGWCVSQPGNTMYDNYRFKENAPTFYFVFDRNKSSSRDDNKYKFEFPWHAFVIQVNADGETYTVTGADNRGDERANNWESISNIVSSDTWDKIKGLKNYFKPIKLSTTERARKLASGKNLSVDEFKELSQDDKITYVIGKGSENNLKPDILQILPKYKINYEGRSTTLANIAIDSRQKFTYSDLKDSEALSKRYAIVSSRYYPNDPLPLPFIKYLDDSSRKKYLDKYNNNLTFEYIEKYFGSKLAGEYVNQQVKKLDYIPPSSFKYIKDPNLKKLYSVYSKLYDSWEFGLNTNEDEEYLSSVSTMPEQDITPVPLNAKQWGDLSTSERKLIIKLTEKYNKNDNYLTLLYSLPFIIKDKGKKYVLLPKSSSDYLYDSWVLMDENGKTIKNNISGDTEIGNTPLSIGYPDESTNYDRIYDIENLSD